MVEGHETPVCLTASLGVAAYPTDSRTKAELLHLADEAIYLVKNTSRDSVAAGVGMLPSLQKIPLRPFQSLRDPTGCWETCRHRQS